MLIEESVPLLNIIPVSPRWSHTIGTLVRGRFHYALGIILSVDRDAYVARVAWADAL